MEIAKAISGAHLPSAAEIRARNYDSIKKFLAGKRKPKINKLYRLGLDPMARKKVRASILMYRFGAVKRGWKWGLSVKDAVKRLTGICFYCGSLGPNGIDRVDNSKGYTVENTVSCCWPCNRAKMDLTPKEFIENARRIVNWQATIAG